jgi:two-component system CheB/CheR fusion protein
MPGMDGIALIRALRALPDYGRVVAIACSGFNRRQDIQQALEAGFDAHLTKPIGVRDLTDTIVRLLAARKK